MIPFFWLLRIFEKTKYILADKWVDDNIAQFVQTYYAKWDKNEKILPSLHSEKFQEITNFISLWGKPGYLCIKNMVENIRKSFEIPALLSFEIKGIDTSIQVKFF